MTVTATSTADPTKSTYATVSLQPPPPPISVTVTPTMVALAAGKTQQFTATVKNSGAGVTWSLSPANGTVSTSGLYTAPATVGSRTVVKITAISIADPTKTASAQVSLNPKNAR